MGRNASGVYTLPSGSTVANGDTSDASDLNTPFQDLELDNNTARPIVAGGTGATTASGARTNLGIALGTDVQAYDAGLASLAGLTTAADKMVYTTASDTYAVTGLTSFARTLLDDTDAETARATLGAKATGTTEVSDWDDATEDGHYWADNSATNSPTAHYHRGIVFTENNSTTTLTQIVVRSAGNYIWMRRNNAGTWSDWVAVLTSTSAGYTATWQDVIGSRAHSTSYQNTLAYPIDVAITGTGANIYAQASSDGSSWINVGIFEPGAVSQTYITVLPGHYYRVNGAATISIWSERR